MVVINFPFEGRNYDAALSIQGQRIKVSGIHTPQLGERRTKDWKKMPSNRNVGSRGGLTDEV